MVIFHSYVSLPEGIYPISSKPIAFNAPTMIFEKDVEVTSTLFLRSVLYEKYCFINIPQYSQNEE